MLMRESIVMISSMKLQDTYYSILVYIVNIGVSLEMRYIP